MAISYSGPLPATGAWQEGDHPGQRKFIDVGPIELELGGALPEVRVSYETYGKLNSNSSNAIFIEHALTGDSHVAGLDTEGHQRRPFALFSWPAWYRKVRVGANSPSLCPTMDSVMYTGTCLRPSWTAIV